MSTWNWARPRKVWPQIEHKPARDMRTVAPHLRARITIHDGYYTLAVVNTVTGHVVDSDGGRVGLERAFEHVEFHTAVARAAWLTGLKQSALSRRRRKETA